MIHVGVIGGTGLTEMQELGSLEPNRIETPFGTTSSDLQQVVYKGIKVSFLARHGYPHAIPPHLVNYRANIWALKEAGITQLIAFNAVGGISGAMQVETFCVPDQILDYSHSRQATYFDGLFRPLRHVDFSQPYDEFLRQALIKIAQSLDFNVETRGVYGASQGPRLETEAEIRRMERDGCDLVGMTGMPEAVLARELELAYASISFVVNRAAGKGSGEIVMADVDRVLERGVGEVKKWILGYLDSVSV